MIAERVKAWYKRAESFKPTIFSEIKPSDLNKLLQLADTAKNEESPLNIGDVDFSFVEGNDFQECF